MLVPLEVSGAVSLAGSVRSPNPGPRSRGSSGDAAGAGGRVQGGKAAQCSIWALTALFMHPQQLVLKRKWKFKV